MGARPSTFKRGGGFLNGVDGEIVGYRLTDEFLGHTFKPGKWKDPKTGKATEKAHALYGELAVRVDGADEDTLVPLKISNKYDEWEISSDEKSMDAVEGTSGNLGGSAKWQIFIGSLCNPTGGGDGFPEDRFPADGESLNWEAMIGTRVRLVQQVDEANTKEWGKKKNKKGQEFDRTNLVVEAVLSVPDAEDKSAAKGKVATKGKTKPAPVEDEGDDDVDVADVAAKALVRYLKDAKDNVIPKSKLRMKVLTDATFKKDTDTRDAVIKFLQDDDNLEGIEGVDYDPKDKSQSVSLSE